MNARILAAVVGSLIGLIVGATVVAPHLTAALIDARGPAPSAEAAPADAAPTPDGGQPDEPVRWRAAATMAMTVPAVARVADALQTDAATHGGLAVDVAPAGFLVPVADTLRAVASGAIDAAITAPGAVPAVTLKADADPESDRMSAALALFAGHPFGPGPVEMLAWLNSGGAARMNALYAPYGVRAIPCALSAAADGGWFRTPVDSIADLRAARVRADGLAADILRRIGAEPVAMNADETTLALNAGGLAGVVGRAPDPALDDALRRQVPHLYYPAWQQPSLLLVLAVNGSRWEALPPPARAAVESLCARLIAATLAESEAGQFERLKRLTADGADIRTWNADVLGALRAVWQGRAEDFAARDSDFRAVWSDLRAFRQDYAIWREIRTGAGMVEGLGAAADPN
jgi:TRAP-type mannitol/chloroaromatic compound transport system substrate-binding protein